MLGHCQQVAAVGGTEHGVQHLGLVIELAHQFARGRAPYARLAVEAGRDHELAVRTEGCMKHETPVLQGLAERFTRRRAPDARRTIKAGRDQEAAIRTESHVLHRPVVL